MPEPARPPLERIAGRVEPRSYVDMKLRISRHPGAVDADKPTHPIRRLDRTLRGCAIQVPRPDWEAVLVGHKTMFRCYSGKWRDRFQRLFPDGEQFPRPAAIFTKLPHGGIYDARVAVITGYRQEKLGSISAEDLAREGFRWPGQFKNYWKRRYVVWGWRPHDLISVVELRPWREADVVDQGRWALEVLYGKLLDER